jgi:D-ribose pyranase
MKKHGHLNRDVNRVLGCMGHTDSLVIADCGLPIPPGVECIDLSVTYGEPSFRRVLESVLLQMKVERAAFASEARELNSTVAAIAAGLPADGIQVEFIAHETLKELSHQAHAVLRTGEATAYSNVILYSGVQFAAASPRSEPCA